LSLPYRGIVTAYEAFSPILAQVSKLAPALEVLLANDVSLAVARTFFPSPASPARGAQTVVADDLALRPRTSGEVTIDLAGEQQLAALDEEWRGLVRRAAAPNVFMDPALIRSAALSYPDIPCATLLAWQNSARGRRLVGIWGFAIRRPAHSIIRTPVLTAPAMPHGYLATPVIDSAMTDEVLDAMLDCIAAEAALPSIIAIEALGADVAIVQAFDRVLAGRGGALRVIDRSMRPKLVAESDARAYLDNALSASTRKKLRQHRRRLARQGTLQYRVAREPEAVREAFDDFMRIEASGWKGRRGTALVDNAHDAAFALQMVSALAMRGDAAVHGLYLDDRAVSMQVVLHSGPAAFTWKTAYDEKLHEFSPGMLLFEDYTSDFFADDRVVFVDSCAFDDTGYMAAWTGRQPIVSLWIDARRGRSFAFAARAGLHKGHARMREAVKRFYHCGVRWAAACRRSLGAMTKRLTMQALLHRSL
jgi:CelD/BcsL family acetyltransferase involved in cellulose biosynthesis